MFRKTITTVAATVVIVTASFTATSAAEAASKRDRIIAGAAIGIAAALLGADVELGRKSKSTRGHERSGGKHQRTGFGSRCQEVPVFGGHGGTRVVGFREVCR